MAMNKQDIINEINQLSAELPKRKKIASIAEHEGIELAFNELTEDCCHLVKTENYKESKTAIKSLETVKKFKDYLKEQEARIENIEYRIAQLRIELTRCQLNLFNDSKIATQIEHDGRELFTGDVFETPNRTYLLIVGSQEHPNTFAIVGSAFPEELALQYPKNREILKDTAYLGNMYDDEQLADFLNKLQEQEEELEQTKENEKEKPVEDDEEEDEE